MSAVKIFAFSAVSLFVVIGAMGVIKKNKASKVDETIAVVSSDNKTEEPLPYMLAPITYEPVEVKKEAPTPPQVVEMTVKDSEELDVDVNRVERLFALDNTKLPIVETVAYKSRTSWLPGRPAWIADYASYFGTSRHFIARSLNGKRDYYTQKVSSGNLFNVFVKGKDVRFLLVADLLKLKMKFYAYDADTNVRYLLKTYRIGAGKPDANSASGFLTPLGNYTLGDKVAIYKQGVEGFFKDKRVEMMQVFGTRWIPYTTEQDESIAQQQGLGMHGIPWTKDELSGELIENRDSIGRYDSSGCIRLLQEDIEEIFAIVITKPTTVQIVKSFQEAKLPGVEWVDPTLTTK